MPRRPQTHAVEPHEIPSVCEVQRRAFGDDAEARLVRVIHAAGRAVISLAASLDGEVVGHILFSEATLDGQMPGILGLAPVGVLPGFRSAGAGSVLVRDGLDACRNLGYGAVVVLGDPAYYSRFGFSEAAGFGLGNEYGANEEFMALELVDGFLENSGGTISYAPEFGDI